MAILLPRWLLICLSENPFKLKAACDRNSIASKINVLSLPRLLIGIFILLVILFFHAINKLSLDEERLDKASDISEFSPVQLRSPQVFDNPPSDFQDPWYCDVQYDVGVPCEYKDEVNFRVIVITYNRAQSLQKCLDAVLQLDTLGDKISVEIWIDRPKHGTISQKALEVAEKFVSKWTTQDKNVRACIHQQKGNAYINGQWIDTWRPKQDTKELALILEDDVSISPHAYRWIKAAHQRYGSRQDLAGYTLQMEDVNFFAPVDSKKDQTMKAAKELTAFMYPVLGTWGYAPHPRAWREFQHWYHTVRPTRDVDTDLITPNVPNIVPDKWYQALRQTGKQESMWEMWHIKFTHDRKLFTLYSNMQNHASVKTAVTISNDPQHQTRGTGLLCTNRKEDGLHYSGSSKDNTDRLMTVWDPTYTEFPEDEQLVLFNYDGQPCRKTCCFSTLCQSAYSRFFSKCFSEKLSLMFSW